LDGILASLDAAKNAPGLWIFYAATLHSLREICASGKPAPAHIDPPEISVLTYKVLLSKLRSIIFIAHKEGRR